MAMRVLIVSPDAGFGGLIQQTLDNAGEYEPVLVVNGRQALELASKLQFDLAILDADLAGFTVVELGMALQALSPNINLILIPNNGSLQDFKDTDLHISGYLNKPFYLPDLLDLVSRVEIPPAFKSPLLEQRILPVQNKELAQEQRHAEKTKEPPPNWMADVNRAAQHLASLSMATASQAALILKQGQLWAYAGHLSQDAAQELAQIVERDWKRNLSSSASTGANTDLARFVRLKVSGDDYMLYATTLDRDMVLVLAFDIRTPISKIHAQASELARALAATPDLEAAGLTAASRSENQAVDQQDKGSAPEVAPPSEQEDELGSLLPPEEVPPPTPPGYDGEIPQYEQIHWPWEFDPELEEQPEEEDRLRYKSFPTVDSTVGSDKTSHPKVTYPREESSSGSGVPEGGWTSLDGVFIGEGAMPAVDDLRAVPGVVLSSPIVYVIHYACVLLPRMPEHHLKGDITEKLADFMHRLSLAFGWRLEYVAIYADYIHWITGASPDISAEDVILKVRRFTTEFIFSEFPSFSKGNLCEDFWAPGYLVVTGSNPLPVELVNEYIEQTRLRQGIAGKG